MFMQCSKMEVLHPTGWLPINFCGFPSRDSPKHLKRASSMQICFFDLQPGAAASNVVARSTNKIDFVRCMISFFPTPV